VLDIIKDHDDKEGYLLGDHDIEQGFAPVQAEGNDDEDPQGEILDQGQSEFFLICLSKAFEVVHYRALLEIAADGRVGKEGQDIIGFTEAIGDRIIAVLVIEFVMVLIVGGCPGEGGETVEKGYPVVGDMVQGS
jgi:hypothetical protein